VKALPAIKNKATTEVEIRWTAQVPRLTTIDEFDVLISDGGLGEADRRALEDAGVEVVLA